MRNPNTFAKELHMSNHLDRRNQHTADHRVGFTLVELLVVIAIIGTLVGLLLPAVQSARAAARRTQCASCIRQVTLGILSYSDAHRGRFPSRTHTADANRHLHWIQQVGPFVESVDSIRMCPDDPLANLRMTGLPGSGIAYVDPQHPDQSRRFTPKTSYVANGYLSFDDSVARSRGINNLNKITARSKTIMLFEKFSDPSVLTNQTRQLEELQNDHFDHTHSPSWFESWEDDRAEVMAAISRDIQVDRHASSSHMAYADGHVSLVPDSQIQEWVESGFDFAKPNR
jgi:prepilin-type N-terminal cleavage/methylation domain-containing protein/prepilin-type processing-associated H-X9-DG protein